MSSPQSMPPAENRRPSTPELTGGQAATAGRVEEQPLLSVDGLRTQVLTQSGYVDAVRGVSFDIAHGETLGIVGESGCGKSLTALSILRLVAEPSRIVAGRLFLGELDLLSLPRSRMQLVRGREIGMVFQDPTSALNPFLTIGQQLREGPMRHLRLSRRDASMYATTLLQSVGVPNPHERLRSYPHQFSGGMKQRVVIAMSIACNPRLLIADEPTTALDVTIQAQIVELLKQQRDERGMAMMLITHNLGLVAGVADRVAVMYAGRIVEEASVEELFAQPRHPYTAGLLESAPRLETREPRRLRPIPGSPPDIADVGTGCPFVSRCSHVMERCRSEDPPLEAVAEGHRVACWLFPGRVEKSTRAP